MYMVKNLKLVECEEKYWEFIRLLRIDPQNLSGFVQTSDITPQQQKQYMTKYNKNYMICLWNDIPVGFIGEIDGDIRVCTDNLYKQKGIGKFMVLEFIKKYPNIFAKIKIDNTSSLKLFESCGFKKKYYILEPNII